MGDGSSARRSNRGAGRGSNRRSDRESNRETDRESNRRSDRERTFSLLTVVLATFDVSVFVLVPVIVGHAGGALSDLFSGLNTYVGVILFAYLWMLVVVAMRWVLGQVSLDESATGTLAFHAFGAGGVTGFAFVSGIVTVVVLPLVITGDVPAISFVLIVVFSGGVATVVGGVVGLVLGVVNFAAYHAAGHLLPPTATESERL